MQDERHTLGGRQRVEHDQQRHADRVGEHRLVFGVGPSPAHDARLRDPGVNGLFAPRLARAQHVQTHPCDDCRQPAAQILDGGRIDARETQPRFLHRVFGLAQRAEHTVGHSTQPRPVLFEPLGQPTLRGHCYRSVLLLRTYL